MVVVAGDPLPLGILRVDLSTGQISMDELDESVLRCWIGGCALGTHYLYEEVPTAIEWSDPRNRLMILGGVLSGTAIPGSGGVTVVTKGAMTGGVSSTQAQGVLAAYMRFSGLLGLSFSGAADRWRYLVIDTKGSGELRDATALLGKDTWETVDAIATELGKAERDISVLCIGPAGEKLVRWAAIIGDKGHAAAHNGVGAVMGSKKLKAVVVLRGNKAEVAKDKSGVLRVAKAMMEPLRANPSSTHYVGTLDGIQKNYAIGNLPVKNYTTNVWNIPEEKFSKFTASYIKDNFEPKRNRPCWACPNDHCEMMTISEGSYAGLQVEEPEYEQLALMGAQLDVAEVSSAMMLANVVDRLGLDVNEAGWVLGLVIECYTRGILTKEDTGGLEMTWGNVEAIREMLYRIARREGLGDVLAEGVRLAVQKIGRGTESVGVYTMKGATPRGHDHRARWPEMFDTSISESGAMDNSPGGTDLTVYGLPPKLKSFDPEAVATAEVKMKGGMQFEDSAVTCRFNTRTNIPLMAEAVAAATGWDFTAEEAMEVGRRAINLMRVYNLRSGIRSTLDRPSPRYSSTPVDGPAAGKSIVPHFEKMVLNYYCGMGWDEQGRPLPETLKALGLEKAASDLWDSSSDSPA